MAYNNAFAPFALLTFDILVNVTIRRQTISLTCK